MKREDFKIAIKIYKWISIISFILYPIYVIYDDFILFGKASLSDFPLMFLLEILWMIMYFIAFSFYYWLIAIVIVFVFSELEKNC